MEHEEIDWNMLVNSLSGRLKKKFRYMPIDELKSIAGLALVMAYKDYDPSKSNVIGYLRAKGYFVCLDIMRVQFGFKRVRRVYEERTSNGILDKMNTYKRIIPLKREVEFEESLDNLRIGPNGKNLLRDLFLHGLSMADICRTTGVDEAIMSKRYLEILTRVRKNFARMDYYVNKLEYVSVAKLLLYYDEMALKTAMRGKKRNCKAKRERKKLAAQSC